MNFYFQNAPERGSEFTIIESDIDSRGRRIVQFRRPDGSEGICLARSIVVIMV